MHPLLFAAVVVAALTPAGGIDGQDRAAGDAVVRRPVELQVPAGPATFSALQLLLQAADVPYGLEQAPSGAASRTEPIDLARPGTQVIRFERVTLRNALDAVVSADPRYVWFDQGGRVLIRAAAEKDRSALDAPVPAFAASDGTVVSALTALIDAIDPSRPRPLVGGLSVSLQGPRGAVTTTSTPPAMMAGAPVAFSGGTLLDALAAIAGAFDHLSWTIYYGRSEATLSTAMISLTVGGMTAIAPTAAEDARSEADRSRLAIPVWESIDSMLDIYSQRARIQFGLEAIARTTAHRGSSDPGTTLDLTDLSASEAVARIVGLDSRYEYTEAGGFFSVRPTARMRGDLLDRPIAPVSLSNASASEALDALVVALGLKSTGGGSGEGGLLGDDGHRLSPSEEQERKKNSKTRTFSVTLGSTTLHDALDAICRAHGAISWIVRSLQYARNQLSYTITFASYDAWSVSRTFELPRERD